MQYPAFESRLKGTFVSCRSLDAAAIAASPANGKPIEHAAARRIGREERLDLTAQLVVVAGRRGDERRAFGRLPLDSAPGTAPSFVAIVRWSRPRARGQAHDPARPSRCAIHALRSIGDTSRTHAASSIVNPPKARSSTIRARSSSMSGQATEGLIQCEDRDPIWRRHLPWPHRSTQREVRRLACSHALARVIHENPAHHLRRHAEKMRPIPPIAVSLVDQTQVELVDERGWLQREATVFAAKLACRNATQLRVDERQQLVEGIGVTTPPFSQ